MQSGPHPVSIGDHESVSARPDIARLVAATERCEGLASLAIMAVFIAMPLVGNLLKGHTILAVVNAVLLGLIGMIIVRIVSILVLTPVRRVRYRRAARRLDTVVAVHAPAGAARCSWSEDAPDALVVCPSGSVLLIDRSTGYSLTRLTRDQLAGVEIVTDISLHSIEHRRPGVIIAAPLGGLIGGLILTGRSRTTTQLAERQSLALHYQVEANTAVATSVIGFGADRNGAASLKHLLERL